MAEDPTPQDEASEPPNSFAQSLVYGAYFGIIIWLTVCVLGSVGYSLAQRPEAEAEASHIAPIAYLVGADNRKAQRSCRTSLLRIYKEIKSRMFGYGPGEIGRRGQRKWAQWLVHWNKRLAAERIRCRLGPPPLDPDDNIHRELTKLADELQSLSDRYAAEHGRMLLNLKEEQVRIEGILARVEARLR